MNRPLVKTQPLLNEIATHSRGLSKPTKREMFDELLKLIDSKEGVPISPQEFQLYSHLYQYLSPALSQAAKTDVDWVKLAMADSNEIRYYLNTYRVFENGDLVATDGHRIHLVRNCGLDVGAYDSNGVKINDDVAGQFVNYERVIPSVGEKLSLKEVSLQEGSLTSSEGNKTKVMRIFTEDGSKKLITVNLSYWKQVMKIGESEEAEILHLDIHSAIKITCGNRVAVVMPMRE